MDTLMSLNDFWFTHKLKSKLLRDGYTSIDRLRVSYEELERAGYTISEVESIAQALALFGDKDGSDKLLIEMRYTQEKRKETKESIKCDTKKWSKEDPLKIEFDTSGVETKVEEAAELDAVLGEIGLEVIEQYDSPIMQEEVQWCDLKSYDHIRVEAKTPTGRFICSLLEGVGKFKQDIKVGRCT